MENFLEAKIPKNLKSKLVFCLNLIQKIQHFLVISANSSRFPRHCRSQFEHKGVKRTSNSSTSNMNSENSVCIKKCFGLPIFPIFQAQKSPTIFAKHLQLKKIGSKSHKLVISLKLLCENHEIEEFPVCSQSLPCDQPTSTFKDMFDHFSRLTLYQGSEIAENCRKLVKNPTTFRRILSRCQHFCYIGVHGPSRSCRHAYLYGRRNDERTFNSTPNTYLYHIWPIFRQIRLYAYFANWTIAIHLSPKYLLLFCKGVLMIGWRRGSLSLKNFTKTGIESRYTDLKKFSLLHQSTQLITPKTLSYSLWRTN